MVVVLVAWLKQTPWKVNVLPQGLNNGCLIDRVHDRKMCTSMSEKVNV
jgi:hypothetical protein